jgi:hypothetical protein
MASFRYTDLSEPDSIRLLQLQPSTIPSSEIRCSLVHTTLAECEHDIIDHYMALSYVWGDPASLDGILIDGQPFNVTTNLFCALRDLRDKHRVVRLWADAICINQRDLEERNKQVQMMASIYKLAQHTIIYLGESTAGSDAALKTLGERTFASVLTTADTDAFRLSVEYVLSRPWFTGVWVFQELIFSKDPWIKCGTSRLKWDEFYYCQKPARFREGYQLPIDDPQSVWHARYKVLREMHDMRQRFRVLDVVPETVSHGASELFSDIVVNHPLLIEVVRLRRGLGATDPRDMVFAHLGLADLTREEERDLRVDYTIQVSKLYTYLAMNIIHATGDLWILGHVERINPSLRRAGLPSWVPDWSSPASEDPNYVPEELPMFFDKGNSEGRHYALVGNDSGKFEYSVLHWLCVGAKELSAFVLGLSNRRCCVC